MIKKMIKAVALMMAATLIAMPSMAEDIDLSSAEMPSFQPIRNVEPVYPQRAMDRKITGYTLVEYTINENGRADNVKVVDSEPSKVFDVASKRAIMRTVYDKEDALSATGDTFFRLYVFELDNTNANELASRY